MRWQWELRRASTFWRFAPWWCAALCGACASEPKALPAAPAPAGILVAPAPAELSSPTAAGPEAPQSAPRQRTVKSDEGYTVWGLGYSLRSRQHRDQVTREPVVVVGYVVSSNLPTAPLCAVHEGGVADPEDCKPPVPAFWLGDSPDAALDESVKVMGFASNYAQIYDAIQQFDRGEQAFDAFWGVEIPNPLPAVGARVSVTGRFGPTFSISASGSETNDTMGILTFTSMQTLEPAPELATLPGVERNPAP